MSLVIAYLSLGSNLGDRAKNITRAAAELERAGLHILRSSSLYETAPQDFLDQPLFLNNVLEVATALSGLPLLHLTQSVEDTLGRSRGGNAKGPRVIDIDILLLGELTLQDQRLTIPHPRMAERRFVLEPLSELAPDLRHPGTGALFRAALINVSDQEVRLWQRRP